MPPHQGVRGCDSRRVPPLSVTLCPDRTCLATIITPPIAPIQIHSVDPKCASGRWVITGTVRQRDAMTKK